MKEATGELNMTVNTIELIGVITTFFAWFWPNVIRPNIQNQWNNNYNSQSNVK